jgi:subtilase family serine protease
MAAQRKKLHVGTKNPIRGLRYVTYPIGIILGLSIILSGISTLNHHGFITHAQTKQRILRTIVKHSFVSVCGSVNAKLARCHARIITNQNNTPQSSTTPPQTAFTPQMLHTAYLLPCTPGGSIQTQCSQPTSFGPTIAIIDAYKDTTIQNDLSTFSSYFGLPSCTASNGCLQIINETGGTNLPGTTNASWALETSLDIEAAHAVCQTCKLLLVETNSSSIQDLSTGDKTAANLGAVAISNSWGTSEFSGETSYDSYFTHQGIAMFASAGDSGYGSSYPSASPDVISVGGTTLSLYTDNTYAGESAWSDTGSGCSLYEKALSFQQAVTDWQQTGCSGFKAISDIAEDADPNTGIAVYDSTPYEGSSGWWQVGGTSLSSPIAAAIFALSYTTQDTAIPQIASLLYQNDTSANFHDIVSGSNGTCSTIMCKAMPGYDGPTGLGSLIGTGGFGTTTQQPTNPVPSISTVPTATLTPTPINQALSFTNITASIQATQATINWTTVISGTTTQALGTTQIKYGTASNSLTSVTPVNPTLTTTHTQTITNLRARTIYYIQLVSKNQAGISYQSGIYYFRTT